MKIGVSCFAGLGGSGVVAAELGKQLAERGHEVHFFSTSLPFRVDDLSDRLRFHQVTPMPYPVFEHTPITLALATKMAEVGEAEGLDLIHCHYAIPHSTAAYLARVSSRRELKVVTTLHGTDTRLVGLDSSYRHIVRFSIEASDGVTAVSESLRESSVHDLALERPVEVIYNFVDTNYFVPRPHCQLRRALSPRCAPVVMHVSNLRPVKGILDIVRAHAVVRERTGAQLVIVGDGPQREEAEKLAHGLGLGCDVTFVGRRDDVASYLACADLYVAASREESFGMSALEAMSCGVPVVAMRVGGLPELVAEGETGLLTPPGEVLPFAQAQIELLNDEPRRAAMGAAARERAVHCFNPAAIVPQYEDLYRRALNGETGR
ncbi:MAG: N-acetyl-alpha-D-glucosaminyl L-malate synthase BshA [Fimbriimonadaceae bacterium]|nr:N-acetyl-alpha-D-glucosaminyl L-malate synthase BshA [Fimbriimonadaceae bacterium]